MPQLVFNEAGIQFSGNLKAQLRRIIDNGPIRNYNE